MRQFKILHVVLHKILTKVQRNRLYCSAEICEVTFVFLIVLWNYHFTHKKSLTHGQAMESIQTPLNSWKILFAFSLKAAGISNIISFKIAYFLYLRAKKNLFSSVLSIWNKWIMLLVLFPFFLSPLGSSGLTLSLQF